MNELQKLLENAGLSEGYERTGGNEDELHIAFENIYLHLKDVEPDKAEALLQAMNKVWLILEGQDDDPDMADTFQYDDEHRGPAGEDWSDMSDEMLQLARQGR